MSSRDRYLRRDLPDADGATMQENIEAWVQRQMPKFGGDGDKLDKLDKE
jgi:hypothetical protein